MAISLERYVEITSGIIGASSVATREFVGLRFTTDPRLPVGTVAVADADGVSTLFGADSDEADFARDYFAYVSPAPASRAGRLRLAPWPVTARPARIYGQPGAYAVPAFAAITDGSFRLTLGAYSADVVGLDFSAATSLSMIASSIQGAIQAVTAGGADWTAATVAYDATRRAFVLTGGAAGDSPVAVENAASGTPLAALLGWQGADTILSPGSDAQTPLEALQAAIAVTDNFGSFSFPASELTDVDDIVDAATYNAGLNVRFIMWHAPGTVADLTILYAATSTIRSFGLVFNGTPGQYKEAGYQAIQAAINFARRNAVVNAMYRQVSGLTADVASDSLADQLDAMRINYYGATASAGQQIAFFQRGYLMGGALDPIDVGVHINEQWLKAYLSARFLSLQLAVGSLSADTGGRSAILAVLNAAAQLAKYNGSISVGKTLTAIQQAAITDLTGDPDAWREVQTNGYWGDVETVQQTGPGGQVEYVAQYTLAYSKNDVIRKIEGSHNLV